MKKRIQQIAATLLVTLILSACNLIFASDKEATFKVQKGDLLQVNIQQGNITVSTSDKYEVKVYAKNIDEDEISQLTMEQKSGTVNIRFEGYDSDDFQLEIILPADLMLDFNTGGGNIIINNDLKNKISFSTGGGNISTKSISGNVDISTGGGNITVGDINSDAEIATAGGDVKVGNVSGKADISTAGGNITIGTIKSTADISTAGGNIDVTSIGGNADVSTAGGNVYVGAVSGSADVSTAGGNINLDGATGTVEANSGAGNINLKNIKGSINANTGAGNITAELIPDGKSKSDLNSGVGNITLYVPESSKATIIATTSDFQWGESEKSSDSIKSEFESENVSQNRRGNKFESVYKLNGGGSEIELNVGLGDINIKKLK